jgi:hypothetical protein
MSNAEQSITSEAPHGGGEAKGEAKGEAARDLEQVFYVSVTFHMLRPEPRGSVRTALHRTSFFGFQFFALLSHQAPTFIVIFFSDIPLRCSIILSQSSSMTLGPSRFIAGNKLSSPISARSFNASLKESLVIEIRSLLAQDHCYNAEHRFFFIWLSGLDQTRISLRRLRKCNN